MKPYHHFVVLMLTIAMLALAISLPTTKSVQASPPSQSAEERIRATLEDANQSLGGDFKWTEEGPGEYIMDRPPKKIGTMPGGSDPVFLSERMIIGFGDSFVTCESSYVNSSTFHGMQACLYRKPHYLNQGYFIGLSWQPQDGLEFNGAHLFFYVSSGLNPTCAGYNAETEASCGDWSKSTKPLSLAEALHQAAIKNGLYEPMPEEILPVDPGEVVPGQPVAPTETGGLFGIPLAVILGSLGIPIAGALSGALLSALLSGFSSAAVSTAPVSSATVSSAEVTHAEASLPPAPVTVPKYGYVNEQGQVWSKREWDDEQRDGFVSKEEYEQTQAMVAQGKEWTKDGWQTKSEQAQSKQWDENNRKATESEDAEWRAKREAEQKALDQKEAELNIKKVVRRGRFDI